MALAFALTRYALALGYLASAGAYGAVFLRATRAREKTATALLTATALAHVAYLWTAGLTHPHPPIFSVFEAMGILALALSLVYLHVEARLGEKSTGLFLAAAAAALMAVSALATDASLPVRPVAHENPALVLHIAPALLAHAGFASAFIYSLLFLLLHQSLKKNRFGIIFDRFPSLEALGDMTARSTAFGLLFLSPAIVAGAVFSLRAFRMENLLDPKILLVFLGWILFAAAFAARRFLRWGHRRTAWISIVAFTLLFLSMTVVNPLLSRYHAFR